jgi:hypothetical protein
VENEEWRNTCQTRRKEPLQCPELNTRLVFPCDLH